MEEFALVEADFQQYYQLNLEEMYIDMRETRRGFLRFSRLFSNLPVDSRLIKKYYPVANWGWQNELSSQMLRKLSEIETILYNIHRGTKPAAKADEQLQPDYIKDAKEAQKEARMREERSSYDIDATMKFWSEKNGL